MHKEQGGGPSTKLKIDPLIASKEEAVLTPGAYKCYHSCLFAYLLHVKDLKFYYQQIFDHLPQKMKLYKIMETPRNQCNQFFSSLYKSGHFSDIYKADGPMQMDLLQLTASQSLEVTALN